MRKGEVNMNPSVEVLAPESEEENSAGALIPASVSVSVPAEVPAVPGEKKAPVEKEKHRAALAYYFALGKDRSLARVAEHFNTKLSLIEKWSAMFGWKEKIAALENRSKTDLFRDKISDLLLLLLDSLTKNDETGKPALASSSKTVAETIKLCVSSFKELRADQREGEPGEDTGREGGNGRGPKAGIMVNVIFKG